MKRIIKMFSFTFILLSITGILFWAREFISCKKRIQDDENGSNAQ